MKRARTATQSADFPRALTLAGRALARSRAGEGRVAEKRGKVVRVVVLRGTTTITTSGIVSTRRHLSAKPADFCECGNGAATRSLINNEHVAATSG